MSPIGSPLHVGSRSRALALAAALLSSLTGASPSVAVEDAGDGRPSVVVTTEMLGWLVAELVGDEADVEVLIRGIDPHIFEPSARDAETLFGSDLIVANGLGLEDGLHDVLERADADGILVFEATDHITVRVPEGDHEDEDYAGADAEGSDPGHVAGDPHLWLDPLAMRDVALALVPALEGAGIDVTGRGADLAVGLETLEVEARAILGVVPAERRKLVSGHESLGYFADRFGFEVVGAVVPGISTQGEVSAGELAELSETIRREEVPAIFTELGTPLPVAAAVADQTDAVVVELHVEQLPADGSYLTFIREIATRIAQALGD